MTLSRRTSRIYMDDYDLKGAMTALGLRVEECAPSKATPYYAGARAALNIIYGYDEVRDQSVFMAAFDSLLRDAGIEPIDISEEDTEKEKD